MGLLPEDKQKVLRLKAEIEREKEQLKRLEQELMGLQDKLYAFEPSAYDIRAAGSILHDFYNGVETIFRRIAHELNGGLPSGHDWHKQLLIDMGLEIEGVRPAVISNELVTNLHSYLGFRHVFRNVYGFLLDIERVKTLVSQLPDISKELRKKIDCFITYLESLAQST